MTRANAIRCAFCSITYETAENSDFAAQPAARGNTEAAFIIPLRGADPTRKQKS